MMPFDPTQFEFVLLRDFRFPGGVSIYEHRSHPSVDGARDFLRINFYLSKDGDFVTIWSGLLEPAGTQGELERGRLAGVQRPENFDFLDGYNEHLFTGYIDSAEAATWIFKALRIGEPRLNKSLPQVLRAGRDNQLCCDVMQDEIR